MKKLQSNLPVPTEILNQHVAVLGKTRSGKSSVMRGLVENLLDREQPVCIVDPKGDWWGIKLAADGKSPGYPVVIFGGDHADVPINEHAGSHVAELFATGNRPSLIDLGGWTVGARTRFWIDFASTLFKHTKGTRYLVVDEIHNFAPKGQLIRQEKGESGGSMPMALHWTNRLASEGLGKGVVMLFASQRPQKVHNDALTSAETLIAMRVLHPSDRGAVADWIKGCGDSEGSEVLNSLAQMARGEGWVWSPEIGFGPQRVKFPMFATYDSFRPQSVNDTKRLKGWAEVDLEDVRQKMASYIETAKANDPVELKKQLAEAKREIEKLRKSASSAVVVKEGKVDPEKVRAMAQKEADRAVAKAMRPFLAALRNMSTPINAAQKDMMVMRKRLGAVADSLGAAIYQAGQIEKAGAVVDTQIPTRPVQSMPAARRVAETVAAERREPRSPVSAAVGNDDEIKPVHTRILAALAELEALGASAPERILVAFMSGYSHTNSTGFAKAISTLKTKGMIDYTSNGGIVITDAGRQLVPPVDPPQSTAEVQKRIVAILKPVHGRVLQPLIDIYPGSMTRDQLAQQSGYSHVNSTGFAKAISHLSSLGFITYPSKGEAKAAPVLFLEG